MIRSMYENFTNRIWGFLHFLYAVAGNSGTMTQRAPLSRKKSSYIRTVLFCFLFMCMIIIYNCNLYPGKNYFKYYNLMIVGVLLLIAFLSKEKEGKADKWTGSIARCFLMYWLWACVSDFVVLKRFQSVGVTMLLAVGLLFFILQYMEYPDDIFRDMMRALELLAAGGVIYNICFRLKYDGLLYNGYMNSASDFGIFSAFLCLIFLVEIYECQVKHDTGKKMGVFICGLAAAMLQTLISGKEIAIFYVGFMTAAALGWWLFAGSKNLTALEKRRMIWYLAFAAGAAALYYFAVKNVPWKLQSMVQYKKETYESRKDPSVISILAESGIGVYQNVKIHSWDQQILIWKEYIREINLFGHKLPGLRIMGRQQQAQNQFLQIIFRYGIIAVIPYAAMFYRALKRAMKVLWDTRRHWKCTDLLAAGGFLFWWIVGFFGNIEYPYYQPIWLMAYLMLGRYMIENKQTS